MTQESGDDQGGRNDQLINTKRKGTVMNILISGGTGFIGSRLRTMLLMENHDVTVITRNPDAWSSDQATNQRFVSWESDLPSEMERADLVINLAGESIFGKRWSPAIKRQIRNSRLDATGRIVDAMAATSDRPPLLISASAAGYYGSSGSRLLTEEDGPGSDFLARVCRDWEQEAKRAEALGVRVVIPRIGIVLERSGGMLKQLLLPFRLFVGGSIGHGGQVVPWIHMDDLCRALIHMIDHETLVGPYNVNSPEPVRMDELAESLGRVLRRPSLFRVPEWALKLVLGEAAIPAMSSLNLSPEKLVKSGFHFEFEDLEESLADLL